nr:unnamed protein product [Digitaria exilis]
MCAVEGGGEKHETMAIREATTPARSVADRASQSLLSAGPRASTLACSPAAHPVAAVRGAARLHPYLLARRLARAPQRPPARPLEEAQVAVKGMAELDMRKRKQGWGFVFLLFLPRRDRQG